MTFSEITFLCATRPVWPPTGSLERFSRKNHRDHLSTFEEEVSRGGGICNP